MRTTLTIPDDLYREVSHYVDPATPSRTIVQVFREYLQQKKKQKLMALSGKVDLTLDQKQLRQLRNAR